MPDITSLICILLAILLFMSWKAQATFRKIQKEKHHLTKTRLEEKLDTLEKELKLLLNAFDDALIITNSKGVIKVANLSAKQLCNRKQLRDKTITQAFINQSITDIVKKAIASGAPTRETLTLPVSNFGASAKVQESSWIIDVAPLEIDSHEPLTRVIIRDITAEFKADQMKREFVANASHELRTPLSIINGYLENLLEDDLLENKEITTKFLKTMQNHGLRLSKLVEDMLSVSKLESDKADILNMSEFSLKPVFSDVKERLLPLLKASDSTLDISILPEEIQLIGDQFYWEQIFFNLTENALKQNTDKSISLSLSAEQTEDSITLKVTDTGKGIPSEHLPFIFNRFYRVQKHHSQNEVKGTGLGLAIVKHAVELHGGTISVESTVSKETTFTIILPR